MTALVEVLIGDWYGERERRAAAESVINDMAAVLPRKAVEARPAALREAQVKAGRHANQPEGSIGQDDLRAALADVRARDW